MYSDRDWTKAVSKLIRLTIEKSISWDFLYGNEIDDGRRLERSFVAHHEGKTYVVRSFERRHYTDEDEFYWRTYFDLEIWNGDAFNKLQLQVATSPELSVVGSLFSTVEGQFAKDQNALGFLLSDD
jgi:hypothetical protein